MADQPRLAAKVCQGRIAVASRSRLPGSLTPSGIPVAAGWANLIRPDAVNRTPVTPTGASWPLVRHHGSNRFWRRCQRAALPELRPRSARRPRAGRSGRCLLKGTFRWGDRESGPPAEALPRRGLSARIELEANSATDQPSSPRRTVPSTMRRSPRSARRGVSSSWANALLL
jgi:hypothetical protein